MKGLATGGADLDWLGSRAGRVRESKLAMMAVGLLVGMIVTVCFVLSADASEPSAPTLLRPDVVGLDIDPGGRDLRACVRDQDGAQLGGYYALNLDIRWAAGPEAGLRPTTVGIGYDGHQTWTGGSPWMHAVTTGSGCRTVRLYNPHGATHPVLVTAEIVAPAGMTPPVPVVAQTVLVDIGNVAG